MVTFLNLYTGIRSTDVDVNLTFYMCDYCFTGIGNLQNYQIQHYFLLFNILQTVNDNP